MRESERPPLEPLAALELLAPVWDPVSLRAAVENGADAVYLPGGAAHEGGLAGSFGGSGLQDAIDYAHVRGARFLVTVAPSDGGSELKAPELPERLQAMGVDGVVDEHDEGVVLAQGLDTLEHVEELIEQGATGFRIEASVQRPEHVAILTRAYRNAIDRALAGEFQIPEAEADAVDRILARATHSVGDGTAGPEEAGPEEAGPEEAGPEEAGREATEPPSSQASLLGKVIESGEDWVKVKLRAPLRVKDGISIVPGPENPRGDDEDPEGLGYQVTQMRQGGHYIPEAGPGEVVELMGRPWTVPGDQVYKTADIELLEAARESYEGGPHRTVPVELHARVVVGEPIQIRLAEPMRGIEVTHESAFTVQGARNAPLTRDNVLEQLDRLGEVPFHLVLLDLDLDDGAFAPIRELNAARRAAFEALERAIAEAYHR